MQVELESSPQKGFRVQLSNARIVLPERVLPSASLEIEQGRIARISETAPAGPAAIDLAGLTIFPGFIDLHIHGAVGVDTMEAGAEDLGRVGEFLASQGVTGWLPTLVPAPNEQYQTAIKAISESVRQGHVLGVHYEGPFVNSEQCGALHREHFCGFSGPADLDALPVIESANAIHMITIAPEIGGGIDLIRELKRRGWVVSIGHTRATP
ncbi:MAG TPA: hypothetical protein VJT71_04710, partial [Pyrinomonadaceae bacterium]|nr:hypothetical protein [Pyrinomonadaceae bacterium]